jgi:hypothetical protein
MQELTLTVVGIDFPNENGTNRRSEAMMTPPGAPIELVRPNPRTSMIRMRSPCSVRRVCS